MRTYVIDVDRLGPVQLRMAPVVSYADKDQTTPKTEDGQVVYRGQIMLPGVAPRRGAPVKPAIGILKMLDGVPEGLANEMFVRLTGRWNLTAWNRAADRRNGIEAGSAFTVAPARDRATKAPLGSMEPTDERPSRSLTDLCPVHIGSDEPLTFYGSAERNGLHIGVLMVPPGVPSDDGSIEVDFRFAPPKELEWRQVHLVDLMATIVSPLGDDRFGRAEIVLSAAGLVAAPGANGVPVGAGAGRRDRSSRSVEPQPEARPEGGES